MVGAPRAVVRGRKAMSGRNDEGCLGQLAGSVLGLALGIGLMILFIPIAFALLISTTFAFFGAVFGMFFRDEGFFEIFGGIFSHYMEQILHLHEVVESLAEAAEVLKWVGLGALGLCAAVMVLCFVCGLLAGFFRPHWTALLRGMAVLEPRVVRGARVGYFHWTGGWFRGWWRACVVAAALRRDWQWRGKRKATAVLGWLFGAGMWLGCAVAAAVHLAAALAVVLLETVLWMPRIAVAACLRGWAKALGTVRECRECREWTTEPVWVCPGCGAEHPWLAPSARFGLLWWRCACGARLPTMAVTGRRRLSAACPECGGGLEGVGRRPAGVAFMGAPGAGKTRLWRESVAALADGLARESGWRVDVSAGERTRIGALDAESPAPGAEEPIGLPFRRGTGPRRCLRLYDVPGKAFQAGGDPELARGGFWGHAGAAVFVLDPETARETGADNAFARWLAFMDRAHCGRGAEMSCAVVLTRMDEARVAEATGLRAGAGDDACRNFMERTCGNLLNGLDDCFREVRMFAVGAGDSTGSGPLWAWLLDRAFAARMPRCTRRRSGWWWTRHGPAGYGGGGAPTAAGGKKDWLAWWKTGPGICCNIVLSVLFWGSVVWGWWVWRHGESDEQGAGTVTVEELKAETGVQAGEVRTVVLDGGARMDMVWCPPGEFWMGSPRDEDGRLEEEVRHWVRLTEGFWMAKTEITQAQWKKTMGWARNPSVHKGARLPVENVTWEECQEFCRRTGLRLPTEAQWEYACRAGGRGPYGKPRPGGTGSLDDMGWYGGDRKGGVTHPVGEKEPNAWGLHDMHGNVWEWCEDWYGAYPAGAVTNPEGPAHGDVRMVRGGGYGFPAACCRSAMRDCFLGVRDGDLGVRPVACRDKTANP